MVKTGIVTVPTIGVTLFFINCSSPPTTPMVVEGRVLSINIRLLPGATGKLLRIDGRTEEPIPESATLSATITDATGVSQTVKIGRALCGKDNDRVCKQLIVTMKEGHSADELHSFLASLDAAFLNTFSVGASDGGVVLIFGDDPAHVQAEISRNPAVKDVEYNFVFVGGSESDPKNGLLTYVPTLHNAPLPTSARLNPSPPIILRYNQPDGTQLVAETSVGGSGT